jgi:hypothetical protein
MISENKLNLACGQRKEEGYFGIDVKPGDNVDAVVDLEVFPWPIESESAEDIICSHYVEHTEMNTLPKDMLRASLESTSWEEYQKKCELLKDKPTDGLIKFMEEVYRILKPGGKIKIIAPYYSSMRCWQDPTHRRAICEATFLYFNKKWREDNKLDHYGINGDMDFVYGYDIPNEIATRSEEYRTTAIRQYINSVNDIHVTLTKR